ncbi:3-(cis-5,6-dihydroxycyclohexa-1,3-dien-1-yl)propanoate dehydrogenase [Pseudonocardia benzenivorans]|uniref:3-(Cis-5,6-dihydroxycyclohexa-1, 3-dien-1-yl)propanoate dehydrogenase n=1 Tax=Pseudonocardia benzenivorans TaxID=228005 RepID=A0ABW3VFK5_9PSEU
MGWLDDRVALVTGGGSGIGFAVVERFLQEGARVVVLERSPVEPAAWGDHANRVRVLRGDVTVYGDNVRAVDTAVAEFGQLDVLVANVGIHDSFVRLVDLEPDKLAAAFDEIFDINVKAYLLAARAAVRALAATRGTMIFTVSNAGLYPGGGGPLYTASKHAVTGIVRQLAHELAPAIRVNGVAPAGTVTALRGPAALGQDRTGLFTDAEAAVRSIRATKPLDIAPTGADHAGLYVLLASRENSPAITGEILSSDGGLGARGLGAIAGGYDLLDALLPAGDS